MQEAARQCHRRSVRATGHLTKSVGLLHLSQFHDSCNGLALPAICAFLPPVPALFTAAMAEDGGKGPETGHNDGQNRVKTPAEARRKRLAASLRSNLRRRKDQDRSRTQQNEAAAEAADSDGPDGKDA